MKIFGLYGKSGTGKSHKSSEIISQYQIDALIDDGILIRNKLRIVGKTAKNEKNAIAATKVAIFSEESHRSEVVEYIKRSDIQRLLIIGTSQKMIMKILDRLELPSDIEWINIEAFQLDEELKIAKQRRNEGFHVIPITPIEVNKSYPGIWFRVLIIRFGKRSEEVTLVRPQYFSRISINPQVTRRIVVMIIAKEPGIKIHSVKSDESRVVIYLSMLEGLTIHKLRELRSEISSIMLEMLGILYIVDIHWIGILQKR